MFMEECFEGYAVLFLENVDILIHIGLSLILWVDVFGLPPLPPQRIAVLNGPLEYHSQWPYGKWGRKHSVAGELSGHWETALYEDLEENVHTGLRTRRSRASLGELVFSGLLLQFTGVQKSLTWLKWLNNNNNFITHIFIFALFHRKFTT